MSELGMDQNRYAQVIDFLEKTMEATKTRKAPVEGEAPAKHQTELWNNVRVLDSELGDIHELAIDDDFEGDTDPYNSTGSHVILEMKKHSTDE